MLGFWYHQNMEEAERKYTQSESSFLKRIGRGLLLAAAIGVYFVAVIAEHSR